MILRLLVFVCGLNLAFGQSPPPPPPPEEGEDQKPRRNIDLSEVPIPEADREAREPDLTSAERKGIPIQIAVVPVGFVPPPIMTLDENGMPKETYRNPLEYPPVVYHVKTEKGTIRVMGSQNQVGPPTRIPRTSEVSLSYEVPLGDGEVRESKDPDLRAIAGFGVPPGATHLVVILWKDPKSKLWTKPNFRVIDVSPSSLKKNEVVVVNASGRDLALHRGDAPFKIDSGFMGTVELGMNADGQMPLIVAAQSGADWAQLSKTLVGPREDERVFLIAWRAPASPAQPSGVSVSYVRKRLKDAEPFVAPER
ncbi:hypothetical protein HAHE_05510 [Haloferula helveola]|uniref:Uncharacterized protein n=1 Tax=Haloferula helveola TaxID=490095 RepID=A0ABN6H3X6_9BACT|nr:hypothetical protein HAHE_05510 [Haloferula helveola]